MDDSAWVSEHHKVSKRSAPSQPSVHTDATEAAWAPLKSTVLGLGESNECRVLIMVGRTAL